MELLTKVDYILFSKWIRSRVLPAYFGLILTILGLLIQIMVFLIIFSYFDYVDPFIVFNFIFLLIFIQSAVLHAPAHYIIGIIFGIKTRNIFIAKSSIGKANNFFKYLAKIMIVPGLKYDLKSFLESSKHKRALFLSAGIWITYPLLFFNLIFVTIYHEAILPDFIPNFVLVFIIGMSMFVIFTSLKYYGDLYKVKELYKKREGIEVIE